MLDFVQVANYARGQRVMKPRPRQVISLIESMKRVLAGAGPGGMHNEKIVDELQSREIT